MLVPVLKGVLLQDTGHFLCTEEDDGSRIVIIESHFITKLSLSQAAAYPSHVRFHLSLETLFHVCSFSLVCFWGVFSYTCSGLFFCSVRVSFQI